MNSILKSCLFFLLFVVMFSCNKENKNGIVPNQNSNVLDVKSLSNEDKNVLKYLQDNGFVIKEKSDKTLNSNRKKIYTMDEAKKIVSSIKEFEKLNKNFKFNLEQNRSGRQEAILLNYNNNCTGQGTYYINGAWGGSIAAINIIFSRDDTGRIISVGSSTGGFVMAWSWSQTTYTVFSNSGFCIDGYFVYGMDFQGFTLGYQAQAYIKVSLSGCSGTTITGYGHC